MLIVEKPEKSDLDATLGTMRDWFEIKDLGRLKGVPGIRLARNGNYEIHRTHFPLLDYLHPQAIKPLKDAEARWAARDKATALLGFKLRTTQQQAIDFISQRRGTLLGDSMRMGKTASACMSHDPARGQLVIVGPLSSRAVWLGWLRRVFPDVPIGVAVGKKLDPEVLERPIIFIHYDLIRYWQSMRPIGTVVFDEAHTLTNSRSHRTNAAILLASRAQVVLPMTGTPIWNMPPDLWSVLGLVAPGAWGSYHAFAQRYGNPEETAHGTLYKGISNGEELSLRLGEVMLRRTWEDAGQDLPPISRSVVIAEISEAEGRKLDVIAGSLRAEKANTAAHLASYRKAVSSIKLKAVAVEARKIQSRGEPVVVWTWHVNLATKIATELAGYLITGDQTANRREETIAEWKKDPTGILVATMAVAQVAVDFSHSRFPIFAELDYTPAIIAQAEMRTFSPDRPMSVTFVIANHVVDQRLVVALERKLMAASPVGVGAATDAINSLRVAMFGEKDEGDMSRFLDDLLAD